MRVLPWIVVVSSAIATILFFNATNYETAVWSWIAFAGWLNVATS